MKKLLLTHFGITAETLQPMAGYESANWCVTDSSGLKYVLKKFPVEDRPFLEAENEVLELLKTEIPGQFPSIYPNQQGNLLTPGDTGAHLFRLQSYVEGTALAEAQHTPELLYSFGDLLGRLNLALSSYRHLALTNRRFYWDLNEFYSNKRFKDYIQDPSDRKIVDYFYLQYETQVLPHLSQLRRSVIHGDANDWNVFVQEGQVSGIIDFGDMVESPVIHELAIALAYALSGKDQPLNAAVPFIRAFHAVYPLKPIEIELLFYLIASRLCVTVASAAHSKLTHPDDAYRAISEKNAWALLKKWVKINPVLAERTFKEGIGMPYTPYTDSSGDTARRNKHLSQALSLSFPTPIKMTGSAFQYMFDATGRSYLDAYNNIPHVGHAHPKVVEAGRRQMASLNTNTRYLYDSLNTYAERLTALLPDKLNKVFFVNSGSAASDLAIRLALQHTGLHGLMVMEHGYHGHTRQAIAMSHYKFAGKGGAGREGSILVAPIPDVYRSGISPEDPYIGRKLAQRAIDMVVMEGRPPAAFLSEPIVGCGGQVPLAPGYLKEMYRFIRDHKGVCISDEVQTGFGRLGEVFWGFELQDVVPDIVIVGKPIANGHPMAAVICTDEIASSFENGMEFFSSFGGNPVSCEIALAVLDVIEEEGLQAHAQEVGAYLKGLLMQLMGKFDVIGDVRGYGLFLGVELVKDRGTKEHHPKLAKQVKERLKAEYAIMIGTDGPMDSVLKIKPPLSFEKADADRLCAGIAAILADA